MVGTHRLISPDIQFKDLALLIIDEEHRFGVVHKERLKQLILNKDIIIKTCKDKQEKYGRWLADVYVNESDTKSVNQMLLEEGLAVPLIYE